MTSQPTLTRASEILREYARDLKTGHTLADGSWTWTTDAKAAHDEAISIAAALDAAHDAACLAYGWLWHAVTDDPYIYNARKELKSYLARSDLGHGIRLAKLAGAEVDGQALEAAMYRGMA